ncbi:MAG: RNA polymerase sigma factor [Actinomycetota bacterium]
MRPPPFQSLLDAHREDVYRFLVALVGPQEAEDCFQETFLAALRSYPRLRDGSNLRSWVLTIAHRKAIDSVRARRRRPEPGGAADDVAAPSAVEPGDRAVWEAVAALPPKQRGAVYLRHAIGLPYREIGLVLGSSEAAARQSVREALTKLREVLG